MFSIVPLSHLVEFSGHLLREELLQEVSVFKSVDGHDLCASSLPVIPGNERDTVTRLVRLMGLTNVLRTLSD